MGKSNIRGIDSFFNFLKQIKKDKISYSQKQLVEIYIDLFENGGYAKLKDDERFKRLLKGKNINSEPNENSVRALFHPYITDIDEVKKAVEERENNNQGVKSLDNLIGAAVIFQGVKRNCPVSTRIIAYDNLYESYQSKTTSVNNFIDAILGITDFLDTALTSESENDHSKEVFSQKLYNLIPLELEGIKCFKYVEERLNQISERNITGVNNIIVNQCLTKRSEFYKNIIEKYKKKKRVIQEILNQFEAKKEMEGDVIKNHLEKGNITTQELIEYMHLYFAGFSNSEVKLAKSIFGEKNVQPENDDFFVAELNTFLKAGMLTIDDIESYLSKIDTNGKLLNKLNISEYFDDYGDSIKKVIEGINAKGAPKTQTPNELTIPEYEPTIAERIKEGEITKENWKKKLELIGEDDIDEKFINKEYTVSDLVSLYGLLEKSFSPDDIAIMILERLPKQEDDDFCNKRQTIFEDLLHEYITNGDKFLSVQELREIKEALESKTLKSTTRRIILDSMNIIDQKQFNAEQKCRINELYKNYVISPKELKALVGSGILSDEDYTEFTKSNKKNAEKLLNKQEYFVVKETIVDSLIARGKQKIRVPKGKKKPGEETQQEKGKEMAEVDQEGIFIHDVIKDQVKEKNVLGLGRIFYNGNVVILSGETYNIPTVITSLENFYYLVGGETNENSLNKAIGELLCDLHFEIVESAINTETARTFRENAEALGFEACFATGDEKQKYPEKLKKAIGDFTETEGDSDYKSKVDKNIEAAKRDLLRDINGIIY